MKPTPNLQHMPDPEAQDSGADGPPSHEAEPPPLPEGRKLLINTLRILRGALFGALVVSVIVVMPGGLLRAFLNEGGLLGGIASAGREVVKFAFTSPWGLIGALMGVAMAVRKLRQRDAAVTPMGSADTHETRHSRMLPGERSLALGLLVLVFSYSLYPSVMIYFLALWTLPVALVLLASGVSASRCSTAPTSRAAGGLLLLLLGLMALSFAAFAGTQISYLVVESARLAHQTTYPNYPRLEWSHIIKLAVSTAVAVGLMGGGLRLWTDWSSPRRRGWCAGILLFPLIALLLHQTLARVGLLPLSA